MPAVICEHGTRRDGCPPCLTAWQHDRGVRGAAGRHSISVVVGQVADRAEEMSDYDVQLLLAALRRRDRNRKRMEGSNGSPA